MVATVTENRRPMPRIRPKVLAVLLVGVACATAWPPSFLGAQATQSRTVTVKKGDTLWDLAKQYLGDPFLWPEIYRLNTGVIEDPHWIYGGQVLKLPGSESVAAIPPAPTESNARGARVQRGSARMTVFNPNFSRAAKKSRESLVLGGRLTAVRMGEFTASPFMWADGGPTDGGYLEATAETSGIAMTLALRPIQPREQVFVVLPKGAAGTIGEQLLVYRRDSAIAGQGQVMVPTGVVKLISPNVDGRVRAELIQKFEDVFSGQPVTVLDSLVLSPGRFPQRVEFGLSTTVVWLNHEPVLPTAGQYIMLSAGAKEGLTPGDQVSLRRDTPGASYGAALPEQEIAVAQVTRVTPWGATAIVIEQQQPGIADGIRARITAKMP